MLSLPLIGWFAHAAAMWVWHIPVIYQSALIQEWVHALEHGMFLFTALLFWWGLTQFGRHSRQGLAGFRGTGILYLFLMGVSSSMLGALMTFSPSLWYPAYRGLTAPWGLTALQDQQLAGVIMWFPAGLIYLGAALAFFGRWLSDLERRDNEDSIASFAPKRPNFNYEILDAVNPSSDRQT
jgi:putative membrane protein